MEPRGEAKRLLSPARLSSTKNRPGRKMWDRRRAAWGRGGVCVGGTVCFFCPPRPGRPFLVVVGAAATEPAALRAFARSGYGVGCAKMGGGRAAGVAFPSPGSFGSWRVHVAFAFGGAMTWHHLAISKCCCRSERVDGGRSRNTLTGQGTLLECGSRPPLACTTTRALRSGSDGVARWWRRHGDEQEAGPVSAALLNAFLNSADFFLSCLHVVESCDRRKPGTAADVLLAAGLVSNHHGLVCCLCYPIGCLSLPGWLSLLPG